MCIWVKGEEIEKDQEGVVLEKDLGEAIEDLEVEIGIGLEAEATLETGGTGASMMEAAGVVEEGSLQSQTTGEDGVENYSNHNFTRLSKTHLRSSKLKSGCQKSATSKSASAFS